MNRKTVTAIAAATLLGVAGLTAGVYAAGERGGKMRHAAMHPGPGMDFMRPGMMGRHLLHRLGDELELTDAQLQTIRGLLESAQPNMQALREDMRTSAGQLRDTPPDAPNYAAVVAQASQKAGELASRLVTDGSQLRADIWQVLTPEQRTELQSLKAGFRERMQERREWRQRHPRGPGRKAPAADVSTDASTEMLETIPTMVVTAKRFIPTMVVSAPRIRA